MIKVTIILMFLFSATLWGLAVSEVITDVTGPYAIVLDTANSRLYCANRDSSDVTIIDIATDNVITRLPIGPSPRAMLLNSVTGEVYCAFDTNKIAIIEDTSIIDEIMVGFFPWAFAYDPAFDRVYVANAGLEEDAHNTVSVIDGSTHQVIAIITVGMRPSNLLTHSSINKVYCTNWDDSTVSVIDKQTLNVIKTIKVGAHPYAMLFFPFSGELWVCNYHSNNIFIVDVSTDNVIDSISTGYEPCALVWDTNNNKVYCANNTSGTITVIDRSSKAVISTIEVGKAPISLVYVPMDNKIYCANRAGNSISVIDCSTDNVIETIPIGESPRSMVWSVSLQKLYVANYGSNQIVVLQ